MWFTVAYAHERKSLALTNQLTNSKRFLFFKFLSGRFILFIDPPPLMSTETKKV